MGSSAHLSGERDTQEDYREGKGMREERRNVELDFETPGVGSPQTPHPICCIGLLPSLRPAASRAAHPP
jgi:hypothetical protein